MKFRECRFRENYWKPTVKIHENAKEHYFFLFKRIQSQNPIGNSNPIKQAKMTC